MDRICYIYVSPPARSTAEGDGPLCEEDLRYTAAMCAAVEAEGRRRGVRAVATCNEARLTSTPTGPAGTGSLEAEIWCQAHRIVCRLIRAEEDAAGA